jgi:16S rRNA (uracil1498-N3)-methyltransferase
MEPPLFYVSPAEISKEVISLPAAEAHHARDVLRLRSGEFVIVIDGLGNACKGELRTTAPKKAEVIVHLRLRNFGEPSVRVTLAAGLSSASKFDDVVEKGTELGVGRFVPIVTEKSRVKIEDAERARKKVTRLEKVALAATKQCRRSYRPEIALPMKFRQFLRESDTDAFRLIFHPSEAARPLDEVEVPVSPRRVTVLVGPEAGFSVDEYAAAIEAGFVPVTMGRRILRTETAGPVAVALVMSRLGEFR